MNYYVAPKAWGYKSDGGAFSEDVFQGNTPACAVYSQYNILKEYGYEGTPESLIQEATENGWYDPAGGTPFEHIGKLLESHGVPCNVYFGANENNLINELAQGKKVIVTVDSSELWKMGDSLGDGNPLVEWMKDLFSDGSDHALVVSGIDTSDVNNPQVILTDSGTGQNAVAYPLDKFVDAWSDNGCAMIVPNEAPSPEFGLARLENFDFDLGHLASVGNLSYEEWLAENFEGQGMLDDFEVLPVDDYESLFECLNQYWEDTPYVVVGSDYDTTPAEVSVPDANMENFVTDETFVCDSNFPDADCVDVASKDAESSFSE